jgi:hypothetical protein
MPDVTMTEAHTDELVGAITELLQGKAFHRSLDLWQQEEDEVVLAIMRLISDEYGRGYENGGRHERLFMDHE